MLRLERASPSGCWLELAPAEMFWLYTPTFTADFLYEPAMTDPALEL